MDVDLTLPAPNLQQVHLYVTQSRLEEVSPLG